MSRISLLECSARLTMTHSVRGASELGQVGMPDFCPHVKKSATTRVPGEAELAYVIVPHFCSDEKKTQPL